MNPNIIKEIQQGAANAFIDQQIDAKEEYTPQLIYNNPEQGKKVFSTIEKEMSTCDCFYISVAFITMSGLVPLLQTLSNLEARNIPGYILTTDYLNFSEPRALEKLNGLNNITIRMYNTVRAGQGFHPKGYIFKKDETYRIILGSSNMTQAALTTNKEWNTKIVSTANGSFVDEVYKEFKTLWESPHTEDYDDFIEHYTILYNTLKSKRRTIDVDMTTYNQEDLKPNSMQKEFIRNFRALREHGETNALLISATGTGKTYASAFGTKDFNPKKMLFLVHREQIAKQAMRSFRRVMNSHKSFGLLSGNHKDYDADYLFSTMQMMSKQEELDKFKTDEFDFIIIDEVHKAGANSYQKIMNYFTPKHYLGMTASPDRTDGYDIYKLFDHNIVYEIRLQQALEEDLLCPFHYFGITDLSINGDTFDEQSGLRNFQYLVCDDRVNYILDRIQYYGYSGDRVKGLIFCSRSKEAYALSEKFNERGYRTACLTGSHSQEQREQTIERLVSDDIDNRLDYIFTVDIFNEGVDIPEINQVILLRPTESPIIFIQQLGRGLRKAENKEFVVIIDFIGNYKNNFMIPIALSGDRTYNKDNIRRYVSEGGKVIPGASTIHFDEISKKRIYKAIDEANFSEVKLIKENYKNLKNKLGRIPKIKDFDDYGEMDILKIFENKSLGSYYTFLKKYEPDYKVRLTDQEENVIKFISLKLANGKRVHELALLKILLEHRNQLLFRLSIYLHDKYDIDLDIDGNIETNIVNVMTNRFPTGTGKITFKDAVFIEPDIDDYKVTYSFNAMLEKKEFHDILKELIDFGISRYERDYSDTYKKSNFVLNKKYTYEDICRLLNWEQNIVALNMGGYKYDKKTKTLPVFINYEKEEDISDTTKYEDRFINNHSLISISKSNRTLESEDVQNFLKAKERDITIDLFVRKNKDDKESKEFYYLGNMNATGEANPFTMSNTTSSAVEIVWELETPVRDDIYEYIAGA